MLEMTDDYAMGSRNLDITSRHRGNLYEQAILVGLGE